MEEYNWSFRQGGLPGAGGVPRQIIYMGVEMPAISLLADESGESGTESKCYLLTLVFHEQEASIEKQIELYENALREKGLPDIPLHTSPLLNGHDDYEGMGIQDRKRLFTTP